MESTKKDKFFRALVFTIKNPIIIIFSIWFSCIIISCITTFWREWDVAGIYWYKKTEWYEKCQQNLNDWDACTNLQIDISSYPIATAVRVMLEKLPGKIYNELNPLTFIANSHWTLMALFLYLLRFLWWFSSFGDRKLAKKEWEREKERRKQFSYSNAQCMMVNDDDNELENPEKIRYKSLPYDNNRNNQNNYNKRQPSGRGEYVNIRLE